MIEDFVSEMTRKFHDKQEKLTKEQFQDCLNEAILSGDFIRYCTPIKSAYFESPTNTIGDKAVYEVSGSQKMIYEPMYKAKELQKEVDELKEEMTNYLIVRATCSDQDHREFIEKLEEKYMF